MRVGEIDLEVNVEPEWPGQLQRALEQGSRSSIVAATECAAARSGEPFGSALG